jgi:hypothetical protein
MKFMSALFSFGGQWTPEETSNKSYQCKENQKRKFSAQKKAQRLARRLNRA